MSNSNHNGMWARSLDGVSHDVRLALRMVSRSSGLTATIALTLALGIGANAAIFGVINSLLLRPLPVAEPDRLVMISSAAATLFRRHEPPQLLDPVLHDDDARRGSGPRGAALLDHQEPLAVR